MSLGPPPHPPTSSFVCSHRPKFGIRHLPNMLNFFFLLSSFPFGLFCFLEERQMTRQREGWPSQSRSRCSTGSPHTLWCRDREEGAAGPAPPLPGAPWPLPGEKGSWTEAAWGQGARVQPHLPAARRGKKNAEPGKSPSVSSGVEGACRDRAAAASAWPCSGIGGQRAVPRAPWVWFCSRPVPGT